MSMLDLIAPQLQPQRKKKQDVKAKVGVKGSTGGKNEPQGSTLAGKMQGDGSYINIY